MDLMKSQIVIGNFFGALMIVAASMLATGCSDSDDPASVWQRVETAVEKTMSENGIPGSIVGVWSAEHGDRVIVKGEGDIETGRGMDSIDRVRIASITKTFTVTIILELLDEGLLDTDWSIDTWFTEAEIPGSSNITVGQLCNMTSGLFNYSDDETFLKIYTEDPDKVWKAEELVALAVAHPPYFSPGAGWHYSNTNTVILGMIITKITGKEVGDEIQGRIIDSLNLKNTYYPEGTTIDPDGHLKIPHLWPGQNPLADDPATG